MTEVEDITKCSECDSRKLITDDNRGELYCYDCGMVLAEDLFEDTSSAKERPGDPESVRIYEPNKVSFDLGSQVGSTKVDGTLDRSRLGYMLRRQNKRQLGSSKRTMQKGMIVCRMLAADLGAPLSLKDQICWNYKRMAKDDKLRGQSLEVRAAAIAYFTYKENGVLRTIEEISECNGAHPRQVAKLARKVATYFKKPWVLSQKNLAQEIEKYCSELGMSRESINTALQISVPIELMGEGTFMMMNAGFTAAIIYIAIRLRPNLSYRTQREISSACRITEVTLRNNYKNILTNMRMDKKKFEQGLYTAEDIVSGAYLNE